MFLFSDTKVSFNFSRSPDNFFLMKMADDPENYKAVITNCVIYVKVAKMSDTIYRDVFTRFTDGKENIKYQFRNLKVTDLKVDWNGVEFLSGPLFPDSTVPCKVYFVLVYTDAKNGSQTKNPYQFTRKYTLTKAVNRLALDNAGQIQNCYLKNTIGELKTQISSDLREQIQANNEALLALFSHRFGQQVLAEPPCASPTQSSGYNTRKSSQTATNPVGTTPGLLDGPGPSNGQSGQTGSDSGSEQSFSSARTSQPGHGDLRALLNPAPPPVVGLTTDVQVYITKFQLECNAAPVDQVIYLLSQTNENKIILKPLIYN
jgi:hypothetical protein